MSRILRRPMFRGGRVDGRGTGITSGLGYKKGGSVQDRPGYFYGGQILKGLGGAAMKYAGKPLAKQFNKGFDYLFEPQGFISKNSGRLMDAGYTGKFGTNRFSQGIKSLGNKLNPFNDPIVKYPLKYGVGAPVSLVGKTIKNSPFGIAAAGAANYVDVIPGEGSSEGYLGKGKDYITDLYDEIFSGEKVGGREFVGEEAEIVGDPRDLPKEKALTTDQIKLIEMENLYKKLMEDTKKKVEGDGEESIDIDKEKFAKALGRDKAIIQDASNMALSYASKALKEGATVKSSFADFFEEEAKRPSSKTKIDQGAAQLAINKYIKGEISKQEAETLIKRLELQAQFADQRGKKSIGQYYLNSKSPSFAGRVKDAVNAAYGDEGAVADFEVTTSDKMNDPDQFTFNEDAIGIIFIETDTKKSYTFNSQGNKIKVLNG